MSGCEERESYPFKLSTAYSKCSVGVVLTANYYQCIHNGTDPSQLVSTGGGGGGATKGDVKIDE